MAVGHMALGLTFNGIACFGNAVLGERLLRMKPVLLSLSCWRPHIWNPVSSFARAGREVWRHVQQHDPNREPVASPEASVDFLGPRVYVLGRGG